MSTSRTTRPAARPGRARSAQRSGHAHGHITQATSELLLLAAELGSTAARADLDQDEAAATTAYAEWRRLRRRTSRQARQLLRVAFDTGYGRAMSASAHPGH